ncbi:ribonuclease HII [Thiorhodococcus mannitoliphagus]|uniref:Ribonuclease HII n=1 Tax=Thiorhodococcus mannitoliphagus TaxID=329406 RepID=A0A6P1DR34_9GAMM|nr:ribonuclease HII [Thiorhodococcus mannitoliphagus]
MLIAGVDEAGRGPLAGPVYAAAVILPSVQPLSGITDSKRLTAARRERLDVEIRESALAWSIASASVEEIDQYNILQASLLAMQRAVATLEVVPGLVLVDGNRCPRLRMDAQAIVGGDGLVLEIGAASILAKVARDRLMERLDDAWPGYGFASHKGYPTAAHLAALARLGPTPHHRSSFGPVRRILESKETR